MARGTPEPPRGQRGRKRKPGPPLARRAQAGRRPGKARGHWGHVCFAASTFVDCAFRQTAVGFPEKAPNPQNQLPRCPKTRIEIPEAGLMLTYAVKSEGALLLPSH